jgi:hypothetical protein
VNWEAIGVIAEIVGAMAVVITLIYLSVQIRLTRKEGQVHASYYSLERYANWRSHLLNNRDLAVAVAKANKGEQLTEDETIRLTTLMDDLITTSYASHTVSLQSDPHYHRSSEVDYLIAFLKANPGMVPHWKRFCVFAEQSAPAFLKEMDERKKEFIDE